MLKNVKLIIFDLDGTVVDAYEAIIDSFNYMMNKLHLPSISPTLIRKAVGWGDRMLLKPFLGGNLLTRALDIYREHHKISLVKKSRLIPGAINILKYLKKKRYKLAVASNRPSEFSGILIRHLKIDKFFDFVLYADQIKKGKPDPQIIKKIMRSLKVSPQQTVYVGDMVVDVQAAKAAKVTSIAVLTGSSSKKEIRNNNPDFVFKNITYLKKIL